MAGMTLASCNYTDLSPMDSFTDKSYWKSANDLKMYANGIYSNMLAGPSSTLDGESDTFVPIALVVICSTITPFLHQAVAGTGATCAAATIS